MNVLVTGASGLIGAALCARLEADGHKVIRVMRPGRALTRSGKNVIAVDMAKALRPKDWTPHLANVDAVVNCAGVLQDNPRDRTFGVHGSGAKALFMGCKKAGVGKVIHFSAIGVEREQPSSFSTSKLAGDEALMSLDLNWVILRPSVVLGRAAYGASAMFRGLSALPILPAMPGTAPLQVVQLDDVIDTVLFFLTPSAPGRVVVDLPGPEPLEMNEVVAHYRQWFGWPKARGLALPTWASRLLYRLGDVAGALGWRPPLRTNAQKEIARGATGDPAPWHALTGIRPLSLRAALAMEPATVQERWFAKLYFVKPLVFVILPFFWIMTGIISLTTGWRSGINLLLVTAISPLAPAAVIAGAIADMMVGILIAVRSTSRLGLWAAIAVCLFYAGAGTLLRPDLWNEPLGPLMKILPILVLHLVALAILEER